MKIPLEGVLSTAPLKNTCRSDKNIVPLITFVHAARIDTPFGGIPSPLRAYAATVAAAISLHGPVSPRVLSQRRA